MSYKNSKREGSSTVWEDENLDPTTLVGPGTAPVATTWGSTSITVAGFQKGDNVQGTREIPHRCKLGSAISFHMHWAANTTNVGNVRWSLEYFFTTDTAAVTTSTTIYVTEATTGTAWKKINTDFANITIPTGLGSQFHFKLTRVNDANDTFTGIAVTSTVGFHYEIDDDGSSEMLVK